MDVEQTIAEIDRLERIFTAPDTRPLSPSDLSARIEGTTICSEKPDYKRIDPSTDDWRIAISSPFMPFGSGGGSVQ